MKIWKYLHGKHQDWCLKIKGDGEEETKMLDYVKLNRLNNVYFEGRQTDVIQYNKDASFFFLHLILKDGEWH